MLQIPEHNRPPCIDEEGQPLLYQRTPTPLCRICYESDGELLRACDCSGTQGLVHRKCVRQWAIKYSNDPTRCEICHAEWKIEMFSPMEKCIRKWNWLVAMGGWYLTILFTMVDFNYAVIKQNEFGAYIVYFTFITGIHVLIKFCRSAYFIYRFTFTALFITGIITLTASQEDYHDQKMNILENPYTTQIQREANLQTLKDETKRDNPMDWPMENVTNRQMWYVIITDLCLWGCYYLYCLYNNLVMHSGRGFALNSDSSYESSESSDEV